MSFLNTLSGWSWLLLATVPIAILALYFLKLRRQPLEVPSTYLWSRTIEDLHVNSLWQRLRQSLLLFLQLLLILLAILACLRPGWRGTKLIGDRFIFMVDTSASMSATDVEPTRLEFAKRRALEMVNQMESGDVAMVISFSDGVPRVEQPFTGIRSLLRQKVNRIKPTNRRTDLSGALRAAAGLANPGRTRNAADAGDVPVADALPATVYIYSDGGFAAVPDFSLGNLDPVYIRIGAESPNNVGIVAFGADRNPDRPGQTQAFARLENSGAAEVSIDVNLFVGDELVDASNISVPANGQTGVQFDLPEIEEGTLRVELDSGDQLDLDDRAYAALGVTRRARVLLVTPRNDALMVATSTGEADKLAEVTAITPEESVAKKFRELAAAGAYDLVIYDQCVPEEMPQANTLFFGNVPPVDGWSMGDLETLPVIIDTDRAHPLSYLVEMGGVKYIYQGSPITAPEGSTVLFDSNVGPLLVIGQRDGFEDAAMGFEIIGKDNEGAVIPKTDWVGRRSFPVFVMNALRYLGGLSQSMATTGVQPGVAVSLRSHYPVDAVQVSTPSGPSARVLREGQGTFIFTRTDELGIYEVREGSPAELTQRFPVNLFDSRESNLVPRDDIQIEYETITGRSGMEPARQELWKLLIIVGMLVLFCEWYIYNRRVYL